MSGEDPVLGATLVGPVIEGIQANKILANAKHFVNNNQETNRGDQSANVDERTRFEMYYPPFQAAIDAGVGSFMCSYNKINHVWSCENPETLNRDLKGKVSAGYTSRARVRQIPPLSNPLTRPLPPDGVRRVRHVGLGRHTQLVPARGARSGDGGESGYAVATPQRSSSAALHSVLCSRSPAQHHQGSER